MHSLGLNRISSAAMLLTMCASPPPVPAPAVPSTGSELSAGLSQHMGGRSVGNKKKVRHHVNPLKSVHMKPLELPEQWVESHFTDPTLPMHVDIGCARGVFCLDLAAKAPELNVVGLEIRAVLAEAAREDAARMNLGNAAFFACNANVNLQRIFERAGDGHAPTLRSASIQFPDPWFKSRHKKRRVVQPELVKVLAEHLPPGGWLWMQSDVLDVAQDMRETVRTTEPLRLIDQVEDFEDWTVEKPDGLHGVETERERAGLALDRPAYKCLFVKRQDDS